SAPLRPFPTTPLAPRQLPRPTSPDTPERRREARCRQRYPAATPIRWPAPLWRYTHGPVTPHPDLGAKDTSYDLPHDALLTKRGRVYYDRNRPEIGRYATRMRGAPFNLSWPSGCPIHHKWPLFLGGPGNAERAEGDFDVEGRTRVP